LGEIHHEDIADILEELNQEERIHVFNALDSRAAANALEVTEPRVQREILAETSGERVSEIFSHMSPVQIAEIISILPYDDSEEFMKLLKGDVALKVQQILTEHDATALLLATRRFLAFPGNLTMEEAFTRFRTEARNAIVTMYIYVVNENQQLRGVLDINELVQADPNSRLENIMIRNFVSVPPTASRAKVEALLRRYRFRAIPVVDESGKILGAVREKDVFLPE
jgi:magnesium transporter